MCISGQGRAAAGRGGLGGRGGKGKNELVSDATSVWAMFCESSRWCPEGSLCASPRWPTGEASGLTNLCTEDRGLNSQWCDLGLSPTRIRDFRWPEQGAERRGGGGVGGRGGQRQKRISVSNSF